MLYSVELRQKGGSMELFFDEDYDYSRKFIDRLKFLVSTHHKSLRKIATEAGIEPSALSRILNHKQSLPSDEVITEIAKALEIKPEALLIEIGHIPEDRNDLRKLLVVASQLSTTDIYMLRDYAETMLKDRKFKRYIDSMKANAESIEEGKDEEHGE